MENYSKDSKTAAVIIIIMTAAVIVSGAVAVPLFCRAFYYAHIKPMGLMEKSGLTEEQIMKAFDEVMDYCIGTSDAFSAGGLAWSSEGAAHFADVRKLFLFDLWVACISLIVLIVVMVVCFFKKRRPYLFKGHSPGFWSSAVIGAGIILAGSLAAINFDRAFTVFHTIFFPGKNNWILYRELDPVILILPQEFFRNCAVLIFAVILLLCTALIVLDYVIMYKDRRNNSKNVYKK